MKEGERQKDKQGKGPPMVMSSWDAENPEKGSEKVTRPELPRLNQTDTDTGTKA